jgi:hypothetical protein
MTRPLFIFDLDGTLADLRHRRHFVEKPSCEEHAALRKPLDTCPNCTALRRQFTPDWNAFHAACVDDTPIKPVISLLKHLIHTGADVWVWSGRMVTVQTETMAWLGDQGILPLISGLRMRPAKDHTIDHVLKERWLRDLNPESRARLACVFDDRNQVVEMWRRNGVLCCQVAPGDF